MTRLEILMVLVPALPLTATLVTAIFGKYVLRRTSHWPAVLATVTAFVASLALLNEVRHANPHPAETSAAESPAATHAVSVGYEHVLSLWTWVAFEHEYQGPKVPLPHTGPADNFSLVGDPGTEGFNYVVDVALRADALTAIMLATVTFVASLVVIYSIGYMHDDPGYWRYFTYVSLFIFSMTMLVSASNFLLLYVFWEAVGVCSYLLIGFWFQKEVAAAAGMKAFLVNRVGDFCFALGVFLIWIVFGTLNFHDVLNADGSVQIVGVLGQARLLAPSAEAYVGEMGTGVILAICLLLMMGACGKSAQFPLHVWLPDAMEGPSPVSALIHAATMVTAGVYMVTRCSPLYMLAPDAQQFVAVIGGFTAIFAAVIAVTQNDLKRVLAYSTVSQLGYMFLAVGAGTLAGITAGMFHLFTHAFFKALLFLGAGSVMHAMGGVIDMRHFGGLRRRLPITHATFLIGGLALSGVVPFAGFWSKDAILAAVMDRAHLPQAGFAPVKVLYETLFWVALFAAGLTAYYTFRAFFQTFYGDERIPPEAGHHAHEAPPVMWWPLVILSVFAAGVGWWFEYTHGFAHFLAETPSLAYIAQHVPTPATHGGHERLAVISTLVVGAAILISAYLNLGDPSERNVLTRLLAPLYRLSYGKFFVDAIYQALIIWPLRLAAQLSFWFDRWVIDGAVNLCGRIPLWIGSATRSLQNGIVQFYALIMVLGLLVLLIGIVMI